ncbi:MAG TPA: hypothetical protein VE961_28425, partial [Pyrinomonadaceae bacterium]|nr:hypothetical protein [Pyrinomonadaceae bacterium]
MKSYRRFSAIATVVLLVNLLGQSVSAQQVSQRQKWEYCAITSFSSGNLASLQNGKAIGVASICYFQSGGCRMEEVRFELDPAEFKKSLSPRDAETYGALGNVLEKATEGALARAIAKLGDDGWEIAGESVFAYGAERNTQAI